MLEQVFALAYTVKNEFHSWFVIRNYYIVTTLICSVLLSLFGALVLVGTIFHWCLLQRNRRKARNSEKNKVEPSSSENDEAVSEYGGDVKLETKEPEPDYDLEHGNFVEMFGLLV